MTSSRTSQPSSTAGSPLPPTPSRGGKPGAGDPSHPAISFSISDPDPRQRSCRLGALMAGLFLVGTAALSFLIATGILGPVGGGIPLLPQEGNQLLGRAVFGVCGLLTSALAVLAFRDFLRLPPPPGSSS